MPYYAPPGGAMTAAYARSLMGLGVALPHNPTMYARPAASALAVRAAQSSALMRRSQRAGVVPGIRVMSGMGMGILPSTNVRYAKTAIPAGIARRKWMAQQRRRGVSGLGASAHPHAMAVAPIMGIRHQPGYFMGPGGGPGGGPFQFPGYTMSGMGLRLGQEDDGGDDSTIYDPTSGLIPPSITPTSEPSYVNLLPGFAAPNPAIQPTTYDPGNTLIAPTPSASPASIATPGFTPATYTPQQQAQINALQPGAAPSVFSSLISSIFGPSNATLAKNAQGVPVSTPISSTLSSMLPLLLIGGVGIAVIGAMKKR